MILLNKDIGINLHKMFCSLSPYILMFQNIFHILYIFLRFRYDSVHISNLHIYIKIAIFDM